MEKPTTDNLKALGYKLMRFEDGFVVTRPNRLAVHDSYSRSPAKSWAVAREFVAREIANTTQPKENKPC